MCRRVTIKKNVLFFTFLTAVLLFLCGPASADAVYTVSGYNTVQVSGVVGGAAQLGLGNNTTIVSNTVTSSASASVSNPLGDSATTTVSAIAGPNQLALIAMLTQIVFQEGAPRVLLALTSSRSFKIRSSLRMLRPLACCRSIW